MAESIDELKTVAQFIAEKIEEGVLTGDFPLGTRLVQTQLSEMFGVSRLPVRDALHILEQKGLVIQLPRKGVIIRPINLKEIENLFELREVLETYSAAISIPYLVQTDIDELQSLIAQQDSCQGQLLRTIDTDEQFHDKLLSHCENEELMDTLHNTWRKIRVYRAFIHRLDSFNDESVQSHKNILHAITSHKPDRAVQFLKESIIRAKNRSVKLISYHEQFTE